MDNHDDDNSDTSRRPHGDPSPKVAGAPHGDFAEDAAAYLERGGHTIESFGGNAEEIDRQVAGFHLHEHEGILQFQQPCQAHCNNLCSVYSKRPEQCRTFECKLLKDASSGKASLDRLQEVIKETKERVARLCELLKSRGSLREDRSLSRCYHNYIAENEPNLDKPEFQKTNAELTFAVFQLTQALRVSFYTE